MLHAERIYAVNRCKQDWVTFLGFYIIYGLPMSSELPHRHGNIRKQIRWSMLKTNKQTTGKQI